MSKRFWALGIALAIIGVGIGMLALFRIQEARDFSRPHQVRTRAGTNFVMRIAEISVGKVDTGFVVIAYLRLENPNGFDLELRRNRFVLVGENRNFFRPSRMGTQNELIKLPAYSVSKGELLSYTVPDDVIKGTLSLRAGRNCTITIKESGPFGDQLRPDEFRTFHWPRW
ncbi:MAG TPA: hypothetical protein VL171_05425 [Verrucomicrobiae bacterium]|nr:hypothetical protein [Verrucomicrobiae bacterium]